MRDASCGGSDAGLGGFFAFVQRCAGDDDGGEDATIVDADFEEVDPDAKQDKDKKDD